MATYFCGTCNEIFVIPAQRGRPPSKCNACKAKDLPLPTVVLTIEKAPVEPSDKHMNMFCLACQEVFAFPARRGRPPNYCSTCIASGKAESYEEARQKNVIAKAQIRVDNLEFMLRSRNTHIKQQRDRW